MTENQFHILTSLYACLGSRIKLKGNVSTTPFGLTIHCGSIEPTVLCVPTGSISVIWWGKHQPERIGDISPGKRVCCACSKTSLVSL